MSFWSVARSSLQRGFEQLGGVVAAELLGPGPQRAVARHLVVLDRLGRGDQAGIEGDGCP